MKFALLVGAAAANNLVLVNLNKLEQANFQQFQLMELYDKFDGNHNNDGSSTSSGDPCTKYGPESYKCRDYK